MKTCDHYGFLGATFFWSFTALGLSSFTRIVPNGLKSLFFFSSVLVGVVLLSQVTLKRRRQANDTHNKNNLKSIEILLWPWIGLFVLYALSGIWSVGSVETFLLNLYEYRVLLSVPLFAWCLVTVSANEKYLQLIFVLGIFFGCNLLFGEAVLDRLDFELGLLAPRGSHIVGGMIGSAGVAIILHTCARPANNLKCWSYLICAALLSAYILFVDKGRTGYLQIISVWVLWVIFGEVRFRLQVLISLLGISLVLISFSESTTSRALLVWSDINHFVAGDVNTSSGQRLEAFRFVISQSFHAPMFGHGLGSYQTFLSDAYANGLSRWNTDNLHTEIGNTFVIGGLTGLLLFFSIFIFTVGFVLKANASSNLKFLTYSFVTVLLIHAIFNSSFKDFGEKHMIMVMFPYLFLMMFKSVKAVSAVEN